MLRKSFVIAALSFGDCKATTATKGEPKVDNGEPKVEKVGSKSPLSRFWKHTANLPRSIFRKKQSQTSTKSSTRSHGSKEAPILSKDDTSTRETLDTDTADRETLDTDTADRETLDTDTAESDITGCTEEKSGSSLDINDDAASLDDEPPPSRLWIAIHNLNTEARLAQKIRQMNVPKMSMKAIATGSEVGKPDDVDHDNTENNDDNTKVDVWKGSVFTWRLRCTEEESKEREGETSPARRERIERRERWEKWPREKKISDNSDSS